MSHMMEPGDGLEPMTTGFEGEGYNRPATSSPSDGTLRVVKQENTDIQ